MEKHTKHTVSLYMSATSDHPSEKKNRFMHGALIYGNICSAEIRMR